MSRTATAVPKATDPSARIFKIQRFCINDGPGIRTTVYFKGCPLRCRWCHNPEALRGGADLMFRERDCTGCGACAAVCPAGCHRVTAAGHAIDRAACAACRACVEVCPRAALDLVGESRRAAEILERIRRDGDYYRSSGGGVTLSGGECLAQRWILSFAGACCPAGTIRRARSTIWFRSCAPAALRAASICSLTIAMAQTNGPSSDGIIRPGDCPRPGRKMCAAWPRASSPPGSTFP